MAIPVLPGSQGWGLTPAQAAFGTVLTGLVPPSPGPRRNVPLIYGLTTGNVPNWTKQPFTHLQSLQYTTGSTAHTVTVLRPTNWTTFKTAVAKNTTTITLTEDPGVYSTNFRYPLPSQQFNPPGVANSTGPCQAADVAISSTNKFVCYQLADGTWQYDTIASGTFAGANLTLTTGTPNRNGATIPAGGVLFFFGTLTATNPQTGQAQLLFTTIASTNKSDLITGAAGGGGIPSLNPGDPLIVQSNNATATGIIDFVSGDYRLY